MKWFELEEVAELAAVLDAAQGAAGGVTLVLADPWLDRAVRRRVPREIDETGRLWLGLDPGDVGQELFGDLLRVLVRSEARARRLADLLEQHMVDEVLSPTEAGALGLEFDDPLADELVEQYRAPDLDEIGPGSHTAALAAIAREQLPDLEARYARVRRVLERALTPDLIAAIRALGQVAAPIEVVAVGGAGVWLPRVAPTVRCVTVDPHVTAGALEAVAEEAGIDRLRMLVLSGAEPRAYRTGDEGVPGISPTRGIAAGLWDALVHGPGPGDRAERFASLSTPDTPSPAFARAMLPIEGGIEVDAAADVLADPALLAMLDDLRRVEGDWTPEALTAALDTEVFDLSASDRRRAALWDAWMDPDHPRTWQIVRDEAPLESQDGEGVWRAAAGRVDVTRELFRNPAGYAYTKSRPCPGLLGPVLARICLLEDPSGERALLVSLDAVAGSRFVAETLGRDLADLGLSVGRVFMGATHTHSAPGDLIGALFYDTMADTILQGFDPWGAFFVCSRIEAEVRRLVGELEEVTLHRAGGSVRPKLLWQRSKDAFVAEVGDPWDHDGRDAGRSFLASLGIARAPVDDLVHDAVDPRLRGLVLERKDASLLFAMVPIGGTGTLSPSHAALYTGDAYGAAARAAERMLAPDDGGAPPVVALVAGAHGDANIVDHEVDVTTLRETRTKKRGPIALRRRVALRWIRRIGEALGEDVAQAIGSRSAFDADRLELWFAEAMAPRAEVRWPDWRHRVPPEVSDPKKTRSLARVWHFGESTTKASELNTPPGHERERSMRIRALARETGRRLPLRQQPLWWRSHGPSWSLLSTLKAALPAEVAGDRGYCPFTALRILRLGPLALLGIPSEPSTRLARRVEQTVAEALDLEPADVVMTGGTGGMQGYADTIGSALVEDYEGSSMYWGRDYGVWIEAELLRLAESDAWQPPDGAPASPAWVQGGKLGEGVRATGPAAFTLHRRRMEAQWAAKEPKPDLLGDPLPEPRGSAIDVVPALNGEVPGIPAFGGLQVAGWWQPLRRAVKRRQQHLMSWPRPGDQGPFVQLVLLPSADDPNERVLLDSRHDPVLVVWATTDDEVWLGGTPLPAWCFQAEIDEDGLSGRSIGFRVHGQGHLLPDPPADPAAVTTSTILAVLQVP